MFQLFRNVSKQNWNKLWKKWKYQAPFLVFRNTETMDYIGKKLKRTETGRKLTKSKRFSCFETKLKQALKKWKYQAPFLVFRNTETMDYIGKKLKRTETGRKLTKSKRFSCFETKLKQALKKWKYQAPFLVFRNTETMDYIGKKLKQTETGRKLTKSKRFSCFETFRNKIETSSGKGENTRPYFWCFETLKQWII